MSNFPPQGPSGFHDQEIQILDSDNEEQQGQPDDQSLSSILNDGNIGLQQNLPIPYKPTNSSLQKANRPSLFHIGNDSPPHLSNPHSQGTDFSFTFPDLTGATTTPLFPPISIESFQQEIQPLYPNQDSSNSFYNIPVQPYKQSPLNISQPRAKQDLGLIIENNRMGAPNSPANSSQGMAEMVNPGQAFAPNQQTGNDSGATQPNYHLPLSNLPSEFRLDSSSRLKLPQPTDLQGPDGGLTLKSSPIWHGNSSPQNQLTVNQPLNRTGSQEIQFQGVLNKNPEPSAFYQVSGAGSLSQNQALTKPVSPAHGVGTPSLALHAEGLSDNNQNKRPMGEGFGQFGGGNIAARSSKRQMTRPDNNYFPTADQFPQPVMASLNSNLRLGGNWHSQGHRSSDQKPRPKPIKNSVYDPLYEQMGLPIDPHLRAFLASRGSGNDDKF